MYLLQNSLIESRTLSFCTLAFFQIWNVHNSSSANRSLFFTLKTHPFQKNEWFLCLGISISINIIAEFQKFIRKNH